MIIGLCGAQGSGKTTVSEMLCGEKENLGKPRPINPENYVSEQLGINREQVEVLMHRWVDSEWSWDWCSRCIADQETQTGKWRSISLADPLKRVCSVLFNYPYHILLGERPETRDIRERLKTYQYSVCGSLTGRQLLQYFGTEVIRNNLGPSFWSKLAEKEIYNSVLTGQNVVIPDIRFPDEAAMLQNVNGKLFLISRGTEIKDTHVSESFWKTLSHDIVIDNNGSLKDLKIRLDSSLHSISR